MSIIDDMQTADLRRDVVRLIRAYHGAFDRIGERRGPFLVYDDESPETTIPRAEWESVSERLCQAISEYTLHANLATGPVQYKGKIYHPIHEGQGPRAWACCIDQDEVLEIEDDEEGGA